MRKSSRQLNICLLKEVPQRDFFKRTVFWSASVVRIKTVGSKLLVMKNLNVFLVRTNAI